MKRPFAWAVAVIFTETCAFPYGVRHFESILGKPLRSLLPSPTSGVFRKLVRPSGSYLLPLFYMSMKTLFPLAALIASCLSSRLHASEPTRVEVSRDLWISSFPAEQEGNNGGSPKLKLKGTQEFFLIDFDPTPMRGRSVVRAALHLHLESSHALGRTTVSTVAHPWVEGSGSNYAKLTGASSFLWARTDEQRWGGDAKDVTSVALGLSGTVWGFGDPTPPDPNRWQAIPIDPAVVQARIDGLSHGFLVMDDVGSEYERDGEHFTYLPFPNRFVASREGKRNTAPYFTLWLQDRPSPTKAIQAAPASPPATIAKLPLIKDRITLSEPKGIRATDAMGLPIPDLRLCAARGEAVTMLFEEAPEIVHIDLPVRRYDVLRVGPHADPLVASENGRLLEFQIPKNVRSGPHPGTLRIGGTEIPFIVHVWNFTLPDRLSFIAQMNGYGMMEKERPWFRLAHEHRLTLNVLPYGWTGRVSASPKVRSDGSFDWTDWDGRFGPLLDGSAFSDLPRGTTATEALYLPINENWPMDHEKHFRGGYWIEKAYHPDYWRDFAAAASSFAAHFSERNWNETTFEFYLNNKVYFKKGSHGKASSWKSCSAPWIFDEPQHTQDFWAIRRFGEEFWKAVSPLRGVRMAFRVDLSRPQWQRDLLDGITTVDVISGTLRKYPERVIGRARRDGKMTYMYGAASKLGQPLFANAAWCAETWAYGADGVVPWQTIGHKDSLSRPDDLALLYPGPEGPLPSLRLKAFRAGQQLTEYLAIYCATSEQQRDAVGAAILELPGMRAGTIVANDDDAGQSTFSDAAAQSLWELRQRVGAWLDIKAPAPRERWHDPRPGNADPSKIRPMTAFQSAALE